MYFLFVALPKFNQVVKDSTMAELENIRRNLSLTLPTTTFGLIKTFIYISMINCKLNKL